MTNENISLKILSAIHPPPTQLHVTIYYVVEKSLEVTAVP